MVASLLGEQGCSKDLKSNKDTVARERSWLEQKQRQAVMSSEIYLKYNSLSSLDSELALRLHATLAYKFRWHRAIGRDVQSSQPDAMGSF